MHSRVLILLRHGKSAYPDGVADHERPLARRGQREAALAGDWIRLTQPAVDAVLCSTATRTRLTLEASGVDAPARYVDTLYGASAAEIVQEVASTDEAVRTLLVVGHEPGIPDTALALDPGGSLADRIADRFPTSAMATLAVAGSWADILGSGAHLTDFHIPR
ncbi:SixA phosphatase family protein [Rhodococcus sp. UNC363MFTsu5.1]|uniref:SixA phosphatase family protein n=1 Tax=Rhodococcus sp. UNC363MFTsu5.1 TaxID=1449069 RepID=UPI0004884F80|nr:histidine phosphatase family protein [Rhodococcus sp. UNC363MFTsu5.1]